MKCSARWWQRARCLRSLDRFPGFGLQDAYCVVNELRLRREARGGRVVGRKIGFTNAAGGAGYGISGPIWNYLYDATTLDLPPPGRHIHSRSLGKRSLGDGGCFRTWQSARVGHGDRDLQDCIEWAAVDFEICTAIYPGWRFKVADAATTGLHVALLLGVQHPIGEARKRWADEFASFSATLSEAAGARASGGGAQVLGSPIKALPFDIRPDIGRWHQPHGVFERLQLARPIV